MSKTNEQVREAFAEGKEASNGRATLESLHPITEGLTILQSYRTTIAIRRDRDGQEFWDGHSYSITTTRHQSGHYGSSPDFSFGVVAELMGSRWWETASIQDWGPRRCSNPECKTRREGEYTAYLRKEIEWSDDIFDKCYRLGDPQDRHEVSIPGYGDGRYGVAAATLLSFEHGPQVLCGFERGKAVKWMGRTDQLWGAILPFRVLDIKQAFESLKPAYVRNAERGNVLAEEAGQTGVNIKRQGDLFFVGCPNGQGPPKEAFKLDGVTLPPGEARSNHLASQVRMICGPTSNGLRGIQNEGWKIWARGNVDHPEHARLRLKGWHRVLQSDAIRAASSAQRHPMGNGGVGGD